MHLATYRDADELLDKAAYYLKQEDIRERLAAAGRAEAVARHTYRHRMQAMLEQIAHATPHRIVHQPPSTNGSLPDLGYYEFVRPELLALIPNSARRDTRRRLRHRAAGRGAQG